MSTTTDTTETADAAETADTAHGGGIADRHAEPRVAGPRAADRHAGSKDPYIRGTDETVLLDLRELRAQEAADRAARDAAAGLPPGRSAISGPDGVSDSPAAPATPGAELERYHGSHRRDAVLYADGGTAIPLERVREVCHDLRQPVAAILMLASAAELRPDVPERVRAVLQEIMTQTEDISATVRQFLDDAKQGVDGLGEPVPCNVAGLAAESVERWRATFDGALTLAAGEEPLHVTVDPVLFKRALGNVLSNGTRAAGGAGRVQVTVRRFETPDGERAVIEVDDSGPGFGNIPSGHGLGLAVVRRTIEAAGGAVEFAEGPLGGALVRLVLPVTPIRPLSADDELAKTFHGEISLKDLAAQLAAGDLPQALADFANEEFAEQAPDDTPEPPVSSGHAFATRISAWPKPMAIAGAREQLAIGGPAGEANPFGTRKVEQAEVGQGNQYAEQAAVGQAAETRTYFGLPMRQSEPAIAEQHPAPKRQADQDAIAEQHPAPKRQAAQDPAADRGFFGLPLKTDKEASQAPAALPPAEATPEHSAPPQATHDRLYGAPAEPAPTPDGPSRPAAASPAPAAAATTPAPAAPTTPLTPTTATPTPTFDPADTQPLHIIPTGQDDTALAAIQLPSQATLTQPPRIPASALRPVAEVQLSLLPGGAF